MKKLPIVCSIILAIFCIVVLYACLYPVSYPPVAYSVNLSNGYTGDFTRNEALANITEFSISPYSGPETILYHDGYLYASVKGGVILKMLPDGKEISEVVNTSGCILGFDFDHDGNLIFVDTSYDGVGGALLKTNLTAEKAPIELLTSSVEGKPLTFPDSVVIASDGKIYFSDASIISPMEDGNDSVITSNRDAFRHTSTGKVLVYNPADKSTSVVISGLAFANGMVLDESGTHLFVAETQENRIWMIDADGRNLIKGDIGAKVFLDNLPGFPDNVAWGKKKIWVGLVAPRSDSPDSLAGYPFIRAVIIRFYENGVVENIIKNSQYSHVFAFDEQGTIIENLQSTTTPYRKITGVCETDSALYLHSINDRQTIAVLKK